MARPLQVYLDDADLARLEAWARARGWTKSRAVRAAVRALTRPPATDPLLELSGMIDGLPADVSEHFDRYLAETFICSRRLRPSASSERPSALGPPLPSGIAETPSSYRRPRRRARPPVRR